MLTKILLIVPVFLSSQPNTVLLLKIALHICCVLFAFHISAQSVTDSLLQVWENESLPDTSRLNALDQLHSKVYAKTSPDSAFYYAGLEYEFAQECGLESYQASSLLAQGYALRLLGKPNLVLGVLKTSAEIYSRLGDEEGMANVAHFTGVIYFDQSNLEKSFAFVKQSLRIRQEMGDPFYIARSYNMLGYLYDENEEYEKALEYHNKCLKIREEIDDIQGVSWCYNNMARVYYHQNQLDSSEYWYEASIRIKEELNEYTLGETKGNLGLVYLKQNKVAEAIRICEEGFKHSENLNFDAGLKVNCECLYKGYKKTDQGGKALVYYEYLNEIKDSLNSVNTARALVQSELQYKFEINDALSKIEAERMVEKAEERAAKQRIISYSVILGALFLIVFLIVVFKSLRRSKRQQALIETQKAIVDQKNHEIMDSINYAKRIQEAILTPKRLVKNYLPDSFIVYKPKDVVAGDFYWMEGWKDQVIFAVADCTGHGVPGAMVSVVCNNALNRSVREFGLTDPGAILDKTRELVIKQFEKSEDQVKDGMDISLCTLNYETLSLQWAGANNPLWIARKGEILVTKGDKQPIASHPRSNPFTTHQVKLEPGDALYLFTDGYSDQFGGKYNKKFKSVAFKALLLDIEHETMETQGELVDQAFEDWRGFFEQLDDVCVLGVRV